jgi:hypothetical protein
MKSATVSVEANGERGEDGVAIAIRSAVERRFDMLETRPHRDAVTWEQRQLRRAARETLQRRKTVLGSKLADGFHLRMKVKRGDTRTAFADFRNAQTDLVSHIGE